MNVFPAISKQMFTAELKLWMILCGKMQVEVVQTRECEKITLREEIRHLVHQGGLNIPLAHARDQGLGYDVHPAVCSAVKPMVAVGRCLAWDPASTTSTSGITCEFMWVKR